MAEKIKRTILCVDDEPDVVSSLYDTFMDSYTVKTAGSAKEALKIFNEIDIALVITDQRMPEMEGTELLAEISEIDPICKKILLTGYADVNAAIDAINKGSVDKYFSKPWDDDELTKAVEFLLSMYSTDEFLKKVVTDGKGMKERLETADHYTKLFKGFFESSLSGVCVVGDANKIEYMNTAGLEIVGYKDMAEIKGRELADIFLLDQTSKKKFCENYLKKNLTPDTLDIKLNDGTPARVRATISFVDNEKDMQVSGIVFNKS
jgi:PAS domain S-box-containing protein